ncbi:alpha/beta fold hydrolase [Pontibacter sp. G13]|uniref:alpha/beta hydrolase n=1 Tax=Pontibacter sp. G13 TaxID=3074898 RepID=UPI00288C2C12|nr:alpha/beta fold hydrolase [Pontibacter sp. G13]WNJ20348.1 alpha/beta fold hydrolase [Pontibacter sp. G13]
MKKMIIGTITVLAGLYLLLCVALFFLQENLIFFPEKLDASYRFQFTESFEELTFQAPDGKHLNGLLFKSDSSKGLVFYLHGNAGSLSSWGYVADTYTSLGYDVFILDYRGFGKSEGNISSQAQLFEDNQMIYNEFKKRYREEDIIVLGYSIGTGLASKLASDNHPSQLILQAPYYSLTDMMRQRFSFVPTFLLKYKFETHEYLKNCDMPITIFHGEVDQVIHYTSSLKLKEEFRDQIDLIPLKGQGHNGITDNGHYQQELKRLLQD